MKILITGGAGFIGSHLVDSYLGGGHRVFVVDNESGGYKRPLPKVVSFRKMDVRNFHRLTSLFRKEKFDVVNHHAAQIDVRRSVADPDEDAQINIGGTLNLLRLSAQYRVKKFIFSSSGGTIYGECRSSANEQRPERPLSPYGVSKLAAEKYIQAFSALHGIRFTIFRYANVYGPRQDPHGEAGVVAIYARRLLNREPCVVFGTGRQTRDFVFVGDVAKANVLALARGNDQIVNIGTGRETTIRQLYQTMASLHGSAGRPVFKPSRPGELNRSVLNIVKAKRVLSWKPTVSLRRGLQQTISYFEREARGR